MVIEMTLLSGGIVAGMMIMAALLEKDHKVEIKSIEDSLYRWKQQLMDLEQELKDREATEAHLTESLVRMKTQLAEAHQKMGQAMKALERQGGSEEPFAHPTTSLFPPPSARDHDD